MTNHPKFTESHDSAARLAYSDRADGTLFIVRMGTHDVIIGFRGKEGFKDIADIKAAFDSVVCLERGDAMTKPSYEELERAIISTLYVEVCSEDAETTYLLPAEPEPIVCDSLADVVKEFYELSNREMLKLEAAESELARVRGLLQRMYELVRDGVLVRNVDEDDVFGSFVKQAFRLTATLRETEIALAESADIGKLDTADEKICECGDSFFFHKTVCLGINESGNCKCNNFRPKVGAESGVEMGKVNRVDEKL